MKPPTLSSPPVAGTSPACDEKNWPTQLALDGAAASAEPVVAITTAVAASPTLILVRFPIERTPSYAGAPTLRSPPGFRRQATIDDAFRKLYGPARDLLAGIYFQALIEQQTTDTR
jgi:hypothetical protein